MSHTDDKQLVFYSIAEIAAMTGMTERFWRYELARGNLGFTKFGRYVRISRQQFDDYLGVHGLSKREPATTGTGAA